MDETMRQEIYALMERNRRDTDGHTYTVPSPDTYPYQWFWDSCFHAIILAHFDIPYAKKELRSLVVKQFYDGMLPHMIYWKPGALHVYEWGKEGTSALTQPPILADAVWAIFQKDNDKTFLEELYPAMRSFYLYLIEKRDPRDRHLIGIINPDESGEDNSPRFDSILKVSPDITVEEHLERRMELILANRECNFDAELCMKKYFWSKDVPFNALCVENLTILSHIASLLGREEDAYLFTLHSDLIAKAMRMHLWQGDTYWSIDGDYNILPVSTWAHFAPLYAGLYTPEEAKVVVEKYLNDEERFSAPYGVRTVSKDESSYNSEGFWRGPVWMAPHWFIYKGLKKYNFIEEARMVREKSLALLDTNGFREYFNPESGEGYGARDFTWGGLVVDME